MSLLPKALLARSALVVTLLAATSVPAQRTWIVDENNGPGTSFRDFPPAVSAASAGDTILIRPGTYTAATVSKGLVMLGDTTVPVFTGTMMIRDVPRSQSVVMRNLNAAVQCADNEGALHLEKVTWAQLFNGVAMRLTNCRQVTMHQCVWRAPNAGQITTSTVLVTECLFDSRALITVVPGPGLAATLSDVTFAHSGLPSTAIIQHIPALSGDGVPPGSPLGLNLTSRPGAIAAVLVSWRPGNDPLPTPWGPFWINIPFHVTVQVGTLSAQGQMPVSLQTASFTPRGYPLLFQAGVLSGTSTLEVSSPLLVTLQ